MKFQIEMSSDYRGNKQPHPRAYLKYSRQTSNLVWWNYWEIEVKDLTELLQLVKELDNSIIISESNGEYSIEIYDGYRE